MAKRYRFKEFAPKPGDPGSSVLWEHYHQAGPGGVHMSTRRGVVWSAAPAARGQRAVWVSPETPLPTDLYRLIYVTLPPSGRGVPESSDNTQSEAGSYTAHAAAAARRHRAEHAA